MNEIEQQAKNWVCQITKTHHSNVSCKTLQAALDIMQSRLGGPLLTIRLTDDYPNKRKFTIYTGVVEFHVSSGPTPIKALAKAMKTKSFYGVCKLALNSDRR